LNSRNQEPENVDSALPIDPLVKGASDLVSTGFLGTVVVALAFVVIYLWRELKARHKQYDADLDEERARRDAEMAEERKKHSVEMAEQRKLNQDLQAARLAEVKAAFGEVTKALGTVEQALAFMHGGAR
jgi:ADP-ribosylglycohydrolase